MEGGELLKMLREIKDAAFATVDEEGRPQVRIIDVMLAEEDKIFFLTARGKNFYRELTASGQVSVVAMTKDFKSIRLNGTAKKMPDQKLWLERIFEANPVMNRVYPGDSRYILEPFCIEDGEVELFDLGGEPVYRESAAIGSGAVTVKGYEIGEGCTGCGVCALLCPQNCISPGSPFTINQEHCLHCGLCFEECPVDVIIRKG